MRKVVWSNAAVRDFDQALRTIADEDERAASLVADRIEEAISLLAERAIGRPGRVTGTFEKRVLRTPYIVAYAVSDRTLTILHVIHGRRLWADETRPED